MVCFNNLNFYKPLIYLNFTMAKTTSRKRTSPKQWRMESRIKDQVSFRTDLTDNYQLEISRYPSEITLFQFGDAPSERNKFIGVVGISDGFRTSIVEPLEGGLVKTDSKLSVNYFGDCGPVPFINSYFSNGELVVVDSYAELLKSFVDGIRGLDHHDAQDTLKMVFRKALDDKISDRPSESDKNYSFKKLQSYVRNSNLPDHYKCAVKGML